MSGHLDLYLLRYYKHPLLVLLLPMPYMNKSLVDNQRWHLQHGSRIHYLTVNGGYGYRRMTHGYEYRRWERALNIIKLSPNPIWYTEDRAGNSDPCDRVCVRTWLDTSLIMTFTIWYLPRLSKDIGHHRWKSYMSFMKCLQYWRRVGVWRKLVSVVEGCNHEWMKKFHTLTT